MVVEEAHRGDVCGRHDFRRTHWGWDHRENQRQIDDIRHS